MSAQPRLYARVRTCNLGKPKTKSLVRLNRTTIFQIFSKILRDLRREISPHLKIQVAEFHHKFRPLSLVSLRYVLKRMERVIAISSLGRSHLRPAFWPRLVVWHRPRRITVIFPRLGVGAVRSPEPSENNATFVRSTIEARIRALWIDALLWKIKKMDGCRDKDRSGSERGTGESLNLADLHCKADTRDSSG